MRKGLLTLVLALAGPFCMQAQCDGCKPIAGELVDFCFQEDGLANRCVQFTEDSNSFYYQDNNRKKAVPMKFALPADLGKCSTTYLLGLDPEQKLRLAGADLLLIEHGIALWRQMEGIRKWDMSVINAGFSIMESGLAYKPLVIGTGRLPEKGKRVNVHYTGYLESGKKFDSSLDKKQSYQFALGLGQVIKGWDEGISIMTVGSRYLLKVPPALGYGQAGAGGGLIPPNATLYFDVRLISTD